jgi:hypothetical protein
VYRLVENGRLPGATTWQISMVMEDFIRPRNGMPSYGLHNPIASFIEQDRESELTQWVLLYA